VKTPLTILIAMLCSIRVAQAEEWLRADIYFIDWDVLRRVALTPERVREIATQRRSFSSRELSPVLDVLQIRQLRQAAHPEREDARLVVDLYTDTDARVTYYASRFALCTADSKWKHPIDARFRRYFAQLAKSRERPNPAMQRTAPRSVFPLRVAITFNSQPPSLSGAVADLVSR
jgi:hypothetical protein